MTCDDLALVSERIKSVVLNYSIRKKDYLILGNNNHLRKTKQNVKLTITLL